MKFSEGTGKDRTSHFEASNSGQVLEGLEVLPFYICHFV
jgi:hypothetical protein